MKKREYAGRILLAAIAGVFLILAAFKRFSVNVVLSGSMEPGAEKPVELFLQTQKRPCRGSEILLRIVWMICWSHTGLLIRGILLILPEAMPMKVRMRLLLCRNRLLELWYFLFRFWDMWQHF